MAFSWDELMLIELFVGRCPVSAHEREKKQRAWDAIKRETVVTLIGAPSKPVEKSL